MNELATKEQTTIIEVNGIKMSVDLRHAKRIDEFKVGNRVRVLRKKYDGWEALNGVIVGFDNFVNLPTIIIAILKREYSSSNIEFVYYNKDSKDIEINAAKDDFLPIEKADVLAQLDNEIGKHKDAIEDLERKRKYFLDHFNAYFSQGVERE